MRCRKNFDITTPDITINMNCDTVLALNIGALELGDYDELVFTIKNYNYVDSLYIFLYKATKADMDHNGEVLFIIDPDVSKLLKQGAFYTLSVLTNALNKNELTEHIRLTENGKINIEYGAQDLALPNIEEPKLPFDEILNVHITPSDDTKTANKRALSGLSEAIVDIEFKEAT